MVALTIATSIFFLGWISQTLGLSLFQTVISSFIGSGVVAFLLYLNGYPGVKEGIPYPIQLRLSFGNKGAVLPMLMVVIVDLIWYAIDGFIASWAMTEMILVILGWPSDKIVAQGLAYTPITLVVYLAALVVIGMGKIRSIKWVDTLSGPLIFIFFGWFVFYMMDMPQFAAKVIPIWDGGVSWLSSEFLLNTAIQTSWWGMIVPNISDICRYNKSTRALAWGHILGLVFPQVLGATIGFVGTYLAGGNLSPIDIIAIYSPTPILGALGLFFAFLSTGTTALTGYLPGIMNAFIRIFGLTWRKVLFMVTVLSFFIAPWYIKDSLGIAYQLLNITWYYSMFLGPVAGVMIVDYWLVRRRRIVVEELYNNDSKSIYKNGVFWTGVGSFIIGLIGQYIAAIIQGKFYYAFGFPLPGLELAWYYGFIISGLAYYIWSRLKAY
ncbi:MAG: cytosine permease, partial [Candidatus Methanomethyliales bacterium]|nr:cytosine permease [Candidatus Methanomethylicales archaeon]